MGNKKRGANGVVSYHLNFPVYELDICSAFFNDEIEENVYISFRKGFQEE